MDDATKKKVGSIDWLLAARETVRDLGSALKRRKARADRLELEHDGVPITVQPGPQVTRVRIGAEGDTDALEGTIPSTWITENPTPPASAAPAA